jgi:TRAP transporter TAXI family solute receptor
MDNMDLLSRQKVAFALATADVAEAYLAKTPAASATVRAVGRLYDNFVDLVVPADLQVHTPADLRRLRVSVGSPGSGTALAADRILTAAGIDPVRDVDRAELDLADSVAAMRAGSIDAMFVSDGSGSPAVTDLTRDFPVHVVDLAQVAGRLRADDASPYQVGDVPAGSYPGLAVPIDTLTVPTLLLTTTTVSDDEVERVTRILFDSAPTISRTLPAIGRIDRHTAIFTGPIALHEGAAAYYRSAKVAI